MNPETDSDDELFGLPAKSSKFHLTHQYFQDFFKATESYTCDLIKSLIYSSHIKDVISYLETEKKMQSVPIFLRC